ncbi:hypothetical protein CJ260_00675 [Megasphaera sp. ASD88]|nr:hypothetical protein CJ260_00675 [Megasphaera sp. ASD88]
MRWVSVCRYFADNQINPEIWFNVTEALADHLQDMPLFATFVVRRCILQNRIYGGIQNAGLGKHVIMGSLSPVNLTNLGYFLYFITKCVSLELRKHGRKCVFAAAGFPND